MMSFANLIHIDGANLQVGKQVVRRELASAGVFSAGPQWRGAAIEMTDAKVIEVDRESARCAAGEDDAVLAERSGSGAGEADDAVFPDALAAGDAGTGALVAAELIDCRTGFEERAEGF